MITAPARQEETSSGERAPELANGHESGLSRELDALRRSEAVLRNFIETSTISLHWVGPDGTILWANQAELDLLGYSKEEYFGRNITDFHADPPVINDILVRLSRGETLYSYPARLRHRDGSIRHVIINSSVLFEDGNFVHTRCFTRDVTRERESETHIRVLNAQLNADLRAMIRLQQLSTGLVGQTNLSSIFDEILDAALEITSAELGNIQTFDEGAGTLRIAAQRGFQPAFLEHFDTVYSGTTACGEAMRRRERVIVEDVTDSPLFMETGVSAMLAAGARAVQSTPLIARSGQLVGMFSTHYRRPTRPSEQEIQQLDILARLAADSIDRVLSEQKLREAEKRYRELFELLPAAVYTTDEAGRLTSYNQAAVDFCGRVPALGTDSWCVSSKLYWPDGAPLRHDECPMALALKEERPVRGYEAIAERPDGTRRNFIPFSTPLYDESGKVTGAVNMLVDITDRRLAENALRESGEMLRAIFNSSAVGVAVLTTEGRFLQVNQAFSAITGYSEAELRQLDCAALTHGDDCARMWEQIGQLLAGDIQTFVIEKRYFRKNGEMIWVQDSVSLTRDAGNRPANIIALCQDITERKNSEEELRASKAQLATELADTRLLQEISAHLIEPGDEQEIYEKIVEGAKAIMRSEFATMQMFYPERGAKGELRLLASRGLTPEGEKLWEWVRFDTDSTCGQALRTGKRVIAPNVATSEFLAGTRGGAALMEAGIQSAQSTPLFSRSGSFIGMISSHWCRPHTPAERDLRLLDILARQAADLIERKRAENTRAQLSAIVESSGDAIYIYDFEGKVLTWNAAAEELYGYSAAEIVGRNIEDIVPPDERPELREIIHPRVAANRIIRNLETKRMRHDGSVFPAVLTISPIRDGAGKAVALSVISRDITARKQVEDELRRANHDLEQFAYSASHDLQEPLRSIKIYGELLTKRYTHKLDGEALDFLEFLSSGATRMEQLVRDLLAYTQVTRLAAPSEPVDTNRALGASLQDLEAAVTSSGAEIAADRLPSVRMHDTHLKQIFQNLIGNAIKYRDPERPPQIRIGAETRNGACVFRVEDNGIGIEPEYKEQIFGLFTRLHTADQYSGTGIGLAICQRIVERYGGRIWAESEPGKGSTFRFSVPV